MQFWSLFVPGLFLGTQRQSSHSSLFLAFAAVIHRSVMNGMYIIVAAIELVCICVTRTHVAWPVPLLAGWPPRGGHASLGDEAGAPSLRGYGAPELFLGGPLGHRAGTRPTG